MLGRTLPQPRVPDPGAVPSLRWAILGTGWIAQWFVESVQQFTSQQVVAVGSRTAERAEGFARRYGLAQAFGSYEDLVAADVDVVYVATAHLEHLAHHPWRWRLVGPCLSKSHSLFG
ncbi:MAG: Gfo/Idh/MocA family oxidoreductase [Propioniciclava sp.]